MAAVSILRCGLVALSVAFATSGDPGRDPCKTSEDGFRLICSNITTQFFSSVMFLSLDDDMARFTSEVRRLDIQQSNLTQLEIGSFKRMPLLSYLTASNVSLREIGRGAFEGLTRLKMVDFSWNDLEEVPVDAFRDTRIRYLNLEGNTHLQIPTNGPILRAKSLLSLVLRNCGLQHLPGSAFSAMVSLDHLDLSSNFLEMLPRDIFAPLSLLNTLDLSDNRFRRIDTAVFSLLPSDLHRLFLSGNPWTCDCRISHLINWSNGRLHDETSCHDPEDVTGLPWNHPRIRTLLASC